MYMYESSKLHFGYVIHGVKVTEFCSISMPVDFCRHLVGKLSDKCLSSVIALRHTLLLSQWSYGHFLKLTDSILFE